MFAVKWLIHTDLVISFLRPNPSRKIVTCSGLGVKYWQVPPLCDSHFNVRFLPHVSTFLIFGYAAGRALSKSEQDGQFSTHAPSPSHPQICC